MAFGRLRNASIQPIAAQPGPPPLWEYRDVNVPIQIHGRGNVMQMSHRLDPILQQGVAAACRDGWEPAEPVSLVRLAQQGRVRSRLDQRSVVYESASVRMRRKRAQTPGVR